LILACPLEAGAAGVPDRVAAAQAPTPAASYSSVVSLLLDSSKASPRKALRDSLWRIGVRDLRPAFPAWSARMEAELEALLQNEDRRGSPHFSGSSRSSASRASGGPTRAVPDLGRFLHATFDSPEAASRAIPLLRRQPGIRLAQLLPERIAVDVAGLEEWIDDPYFRAWWGLPEDPQWCLYNQGKRAGAGGCGDAVAGCDLRIRSVWDELSAANDPPGAAMAGASPGDPSVVLGFLDVGIWDAHPDLNVLQGFSRDPRVNLCPPHDWCGDHGTKMAGLAAARTNNALGIAGVAGGCSILDLAVPACPCATCDLPQEACGYISASWYTRLPGILTVPLGSTEEGRPRTLVALNASFGVTDYAPLEEFEAVDLCRRAGILVVASSGDRSTQAPVPVQPANLPFVLGVGGSTWEDRFWDAAFSCYGGVSGATVGPGNIQVSAPACGTMLTTLNFDHPLGGGPYAETSGQCSAAAALTTGTVGLLQSFALNASPLRRLLTPDEVMGLIGATTRPYSADPTEGATCPPSLCPLEDYGSGIVSVENAVFVLRHADRWQERFFAATNGWEVEFVPPEFTDEHGRLYREYRVSMSFSIPPRPDALEAPADLPRIVAWPIRDRSTTLCAYGPWPDRFEYAATSVPDCSLRLDRETGEATLSGANFVEVVDGREIPLVPWSEIRMGVGFWAVGEAVGAGDAGVGPGADLPPGGSLFLQAAPNPARGEVRILLRLPARTALRLEVVDAAGRVRRRIPKAGMGPGHAMLRWDGRDTQGRSVPTGVYWLRMRMETTRPSGAGGEERVEVRPILVIR